MRETGVKIGVLSIRSYRPFPLEAVQHALKGAHRVVNLEKSFSVGIGVVVAADVRMALAGRLHMRNFTIVAGLGGRPITQASLTRALTAAVEGTLKPLTFLDLNEEVVNLHLAREASTRRSGPIAESLLRIMSKKSGGAS